MAQSTPRILFIPFEFLTWQRGGSWPYSVHLGLEEGLTAHGIDFVTIPSTYELPSSYPASWLYHVRHLCAGQKFDQVWFFLRHAQLDEALLHWAADIAPVRVGFVMESLTYLPEELEASPHLAEVVPFMERQMASMTHILAFDERDADELHARGRQAMWCPWAIPQRFLAAPPVVHKEPRAAFFGSLNAKREALLSHPAVRDILACPPRVESGMELPGVFDDAAMHYHARLHNGHLPSLADLHDYLSVVRHVRRTVFDRYLDVLSRQAANVVLPTGFKGYSNRIVESAAARLPAISWDVPERPRNRALFEPGREILLFDPASPEALADCIRQVLQFPDFARELARSLHEKVLFRHTVEVRTGEILRWIETGVEPSYTQIPGAAAFDNIPS